MNRKDREGLTVEMRELSGAYKEMKALELETTQRQPVLQLDRRTPLQAAGLLATTDASGPRGGGPPSLEDLRRLSDEILAKRRRIEEF